MTTPDLVNHPPHYVTESGIEAIEVMERYELGPHLFCAMKYLLRANRKGRRTEDLAKARWYLQRWWSRYLDGLEKAPCPDLDESFYWCDPDEIADAFGLEGDHRAAAIKVLQVAVFNDGVSPGRRIIAAIELLDQAIAAAKSSEG